ncbi:MAG: hypothetical protein Q9170_006300 [Blastenia crenularia]
MAATRITRRSATKAVGKELVEQQQPTAPIQPKKATVSKSASANGKTSRKASAKNDGIEAPKVTKPATSTKWKPAQGSQGNASMARKRKRETSLKHEEDPDELPHGLGKLWKPNEHGEPTADSNITTPGTTKPADAKAVVKTESTSPPSSDPVQVSADVAAPTTSDTSPEKKFRKKAHPYGLTPGVTPFPDWPHPTPEECQQVNDLLSSIHGEIKAPEKIPAPSLTFAGCGEVPCVLDAMIRTLLSAATSGANSTRAFKGLLEEFGQQKSGIGKGSVNWDAVRRSPVERVKNAIQSGGLADAKSKNIKKILDMVYEENQTRRDALVKAEGGKSGDPKAAACLPKGAESETKDEKILEIARGNQDILSLDHLHAMSKDDAFNHMLQYPGIGVKTASCVTLFCLRHPSFAVDTHVFRLCQWLGWVPKNATRDTTFNHCEVRVPEELKYSLHQLLIMHGKKCGRCRAITGESSEGWDKGCVIDHLVMRTGTKKGGGASPVKGKGGRKRKNDEDDESEGDGGDGENSFEASPEPTRAKKSTKASSKNRTPTKSKKKVKK